jgi:hypothetical protein
MGTLEGLIFGFIEIGTLIKGLEIEEGCHSIANDHAVDILWHKLCCDARSVHGLHPSGWRPAHSLSCCVAFLVKTGTIGGAFR